ERSGENEARAVHDNPPWNGRKPRRNYKGKRQKAKPLPFAFYLHISPFQSSGSGATERKISMCHLPPPHGSITSAATTSTRISEKMRPSGSPSRWYAGSSQPKFGYSINVRNRSYPSSTTMSWPQGRFRV